MRTEQSEIYYALQYFPSEDIVYLRLNISEEVEDFQQGKNLSVVWKKQTNNFFSYLQMKCIYFIPHTAVYQ